MGELTHFFKLHKAINKMVPKEPGRYLAKLKRSQAIYDPPKECYIKRG